ncbi:MAG: 30S ribosomal protein S11 [Candidatus Marinimicrobia bacterium]|nr:30S ribosomal protein S11 [Candidatus Neomarinimicrobiota bacterium]
MKATKTKKTKIKKTKKEFQPVAQGRAYIQATFNNTIITFTNMEGDTICWGSSGEVGFKGARKSTPFAAVSTVEAAAKKALAKGIKEVEVFIKGPGPGRDSALRALRTVGVKMSLIADVTPIPHNGPRPRKKRRV